jgi:nucleoside-diphosphate-sugar epimerase
MKALVTGANGFLGRHVVGALLARGIEVRAMVRPAACLEALGWSSSSVEAFRADLRSSRELGHAFEGVDVLLHLAAVVSGEEEAQFAGTVVGTERLLNGNYREFRAGLGMIGAKEPDDAATQRAPYPRRPPRSVAGRRRSQKRL